MQRRFRRQPLGGVSFTQHISPNVKNAIGRAIRDHLSKKQMVGVNGVLSKSYFFNEFQKR